MEKCFSDIKNCYSSVLSFFFFNELLKSACDSLSAVSSSKNPPN